MSLPEYIGHLHPVLVHLPIGILLTAILFEWLSHRKGFRKLRKSVQWMLVLGFISAAFSAFTGYLLSLSGDYDPALLNTHQWLGISVAVLSLILVLLRPRKEKELKLAYSALLFALALLVVIAGHAGGSLTHGAGFLTPPAMSSWFGEQHKAIALPADLKSALLYTDLVAPILKDKCSRCHGPSRQKGKLRLDQPEFILKGGKDGPVIRTDPWDDSELLNRIHLDLEDEDHMPPKEKDQLNAVEIGLVSYWIETGADFQLKVGALPQADSMVAVLTASSSAGTSNSSETPVEDVPMPDAKTVEELKAGGVAVSFLGKGNGSLSLNFINADSTRLPQLMKMLPKVKQQVTDLKLMGCRLLPTDLEPLAQMTSIRQLHLENTAITDGDLRAIQSLPQLEYLNLVGTAVTISGLDKLTSLKKLRRIYLYQTRITPEDQDTVRRLFPKAAVDFGYYRVPMLPADTSVITKPYVVPKN